MATYVLVHGASAGGWMWKQMRSYLQAAGHEVYTPTLTGLGERIHLASPNVNLDTHIQDVVNVLVYEDLWDVILVGGSYGGMVITGVADQVPERLQQLAYLDAFAPHDGEALVDIGAPDDGAFELPTLSHGVRAAARDGQWQLPSGRADPRMAPYLIATWTQPIQLRRPSGTVPRTFIRCTRFELTPTVSPDLETSAERARTEPDWRYYELAAGHNAALAAPRETAELLLNLVAANSPPQGRP